MKSNQWYSENTKFYQVTLHFSSSYKLPTEKRKRTVQRLFNYETAHWSDITHWSDSILAVTCCICGSPRTNLFAATHTGSLGGCDGGDDWPSPWCREPRWNPSAFRRVPRGTAPASAQHRRCLLYAYDNPAKNTEWRKLSKNLRVVWRNQSHFADRVLI